MTKVQMDIKEVLVLIKYALERNNVNGALGLVNDVIEQLPEPKKEEGP